MDDRSPVVRRRRHLSIVVAAVVVAVALPSVARAHAHLVSSDPPAGAHLSAAPAELVLVLDEPYAHGSEHVVVRRANGTAVPLAAPSGSGRVVRQPLPARLRGIFVVSWNVVSNDGHLSAGGLAFSVGAGGVLPIVAASTEATPWSQVVAAWAFFVGLALAFGGLLSEQLVWRGRARRAPVELGVFVSAASAAALLVLLAGARSNGGFRAGLHGAALRAAYESRPGALTLAVVGSLVASVPLLLVPRTRALALLPLAAAAILTSARGHAGTSGRWWAPVVDSIHLLAVAAWVGALAHLAVVLVREPDRANAAQAAIRRYSRLALPTVLVVLGSGILDALAEFRSLHAVLHTGYGQTLLVKSAIVLATILAASANRLLALPRRPPLLRRLTLGESALALAVLAAVGLLTNLAPPRATAAGGTAASQRTLGGPALLARVTKAMTAVPSVEVTERLANGTRAIGGPATYRLTGGAFLAEEPYSAGALGVRVAGRIGKLTELTFAVASPGARYRLWLDDTFRVRREEVEAAELRSRRSFDYPRGRAIVPARVDPQKVPTGPFTSARENGDLAVGFAAVPAGAGHVTLTATVIGIDGNGATAVLVDLSLASKIEAHGPAVACGAGCYHVTLPFSGHPEEAVVRIRRLGHRPSAVHFAFPSVWTPPAAAQIVQAATATFVGLRSVAIDEYLRSSPSYTAHTRWRLEAPDRLTYTAVGGGAQGVVIGKRRWDRSSGGKWVESAQLPLHQPTATWGAAPAQAALLGSGRVSGREVWRVSFADASIPAWYTVAIDKRTLRTLAVQMVAPAHFMRHTYYDFNVSPTIRPPK